MSALKFLLDEDVSHQTLGRLRGQGFTVESLRTLGLSGAKNRNLLDFAISEGFIFIFFCEFDQGHVHRLCFSAY